MNFASLLSAFGLAAVKAEARRAAQNFGKQAAIAGATGLLVLTAIGLALAALIVWLAGEVGTIWALLIVAGGLLVITAILQLAVRMAGRRRPATYRSSVPPPGFSGAAAPPPGPSPFAAATGEPPPPGSVLGSAAVVAIVGFLLARQLGKK